MKVNLFLLLLASLCYATQAVKFERRKSHKKRPNSSFIQIESYHDMEMNNAFLNELDLEDKLDSNIKVQAPYRDYNSEIAVDEEKLTEKIKDDLTGEDINYQFD